MPDVEDDGVRLDRDVDEIFRVVRFHPLIAEVPDLHGLVGAVGLARAVDLGRPSEPLDGVPLAVGDLPVDCEILRPLAPITLSNRGVRGCRR